MAPGKLSRSMSDLAEFFGVKRRGSNASKNSLRSFTDDLENGLKVAREDIKAGVDRIKNRNKPLHGDALKASISKPVPKQDLGKPVPKKHRRRRHHRSSSSRKPKTDKRQTNPREPRAEEKPWNPHKSRAAERAPHPHRARADERQPSPHRPRADERQRIPRKPLPYEGPPIPGEVQSGKPRIDRSRPHIQSMYAELHDDAIPAPLRLSDHRTEPRARSRRERSPPSPSVYPSVVPPTPAPYLKGSPYPVPPPERPRPGVKPMGLCRNCRLHFADDRDTELCLDCTSDDKESNLPLPTSKGFGPTSEGFSLPDHPNILNVCRVCSTCNGVDSRILLCKPCADYAIDPRNHSVLPLTEAQRYTRAIKHPRPEIRLRNKPLPNVPSKVNPLGRIPPPVPEHEVYNPNPPSSKDEKKSRGTPVSPKEPRLDRFSFQTDSVRDPASPSPISPLPTRRGAVREPHGRKRSNAVPPPVSEGEGEDDVVRNTQFYEYWDDLLKTGESRERLDKRRRNRKR